MGILHLFFKKLNYLAFGHSAMRFANLATASCLTCGDTRVRSPTSFIILFPTKNTNKNGY